MEASKLHEDHGEYAQAVQVLMDGKLYVEAAETVKHLERTHAFSFEMSSYEIAKKYILRYCRSPNSLNQTEERTFYGLLKYVKDDHKIIFLKHAKKFAEALKLHLDSHEFSNFFRLALAQG